MEGINTANKTNIKREHLTVWLTLIDQILPHFYTNTLLSILQSQHSCKAHCNIEEDFLQEQAVFNRLWKRKVGIWNGEVMKAHCVTLHSVDVKL